MLDAIYNNKRQQEGILDNKQKYKQAFMESFSIDESALGDKLEYNTIPEWDSVGHMGLITELEDSFDIEMEMDDIIDFSSFNKGMELVSKYGVEF